MCALGCGRDSAARRPNKRPVLGCAGKARLKHPASDGHPLWGLNRGWFSKGLSSQAGDVDPRRPELFPGDWWLQPGETRLGYGAGGGGRAPERADEGVQAVRPGPLPSKRRGKTMSPVEHEEPLNTKENA